MIEVLFAESEAASVKAAKSMAAKYAVCSKTIQTVSGPASVWVSHKKKPQNYLEGNAEEVVCLGFMLDIGDIKQAADSSYRKELVHSMYEQEQWGKEYVDKELLDVYAGELARLKQYLADQQQIRIWYGDAPYSRCGFYHVCSLLRNYTNEVYVVKLPEYIVREDGVIISYKNWGEVASEELASFLPYEKKLSKEEVRMNACHWSGLAEDNSPLRAMVSGELIGVPIDFYDFLIWKRLTHAPVKEARLIGDLLGSSRISIGDWWYASRIEHYIKKGVIRVVEDSKNKYARVICLQ